MPGKVRVNRCVTNGFTNRLRVYLIINIICNVRLTSFHPPHISNFKIVQALATPCCNWPDRLTISTAVSTSLDVDFLKAAQHAGLSLTSCDWPMKAPSPRRHARAIASPTSAAAAPQAALMATSCQEPGCDEAFIMLWSIRVRLCVSEEFTDFLL